MASTEFWSLSRAEQRDALEVASGRSGRRAHLLEKDIWVVQTLRAVMGSPFGGDLTFKGGTSLSKAYHAIRRFSEDLDVTYDVRAIAPDLVAGLGDDPLPATRSQEGKWTGVIRRRLEAWVEGNAKPAIDADFDRHGLTARVRAVGEILVVEYEPLIPGYGFVRPEVMVEFGARSTGEPRHAREIGCDAAPHLTEVEFPSASAVVMLAERTFWEKATAVHVFCRQQRTRGERLSRHWHDLVRLDDAGYADKALADRELALAVARHKAVFFREKDTAQGWIDYEAAVSGNLQLVPQSPAYKALSDDYDRMLSDGMFLDDAEGFEDLMERCADLQNRANGSSQS